MARSSGKRPAVPRAAVIFAVVVFLLPGAIFATKGALALFDRFAPRSEVAATLTSAEVDVRAGGDGEGASISVVLGQTDAGDEFEVNDRAVYELARNRLPLPVFVERVLLTGRVVTVRSDFGTVANVGGANDLAPAVLGLGMGALLSTAAFAVPWQPAQRKRNRQRNKPPPPVDRSALLSVGAAAAAIVIATAAWDLLR